MPDESSEYKQQEFAAENAGVILFCGIAVLIFIALYFGYEKFLVGTKLLDGYLELCAYLSSQLLNAIGVEHLLAPSSDSLMTIMQINKLGILIEVDKGSDASTVFMVLISTIAAWPGQALKKVAAILLGIGTMFALNILRIVGMFLVELHVPLQFGLFNAYIFPLALIMAAAIYFLCWVKVSGTHPSL